MRRGDAKILVRPNEAIKFGEKRDRAAKAPPSLGGSIRSSRTLADMTGGRFYANRFKNQRGAQGDRAVRTRKTLRQDDEMRTKTMWQQTVRLVGKFG